MDTQELVPVAPGRGRGFLALRLERREECLEPFEGRRVFADPDELDAAETGRWVRALPHVPDVLEDGRPGCDADTGPDQDGDLVVEDVFGGCAVRAVDAEFWHLLTVLERDLVHAHWVDVVVQFRLRNACSKRVAECAGEVTYLADVH